MKSERRHYCFCFPPHEPSIPSVGPAAEASGPPSGRPSRRLPRAPAHRLRRRCTVMHRRRLALGARAGPPPPAAPVLQPLPTPAAQLARLRGGARHAGGRRPFPRRRALHLARHYRRHSRQPQASPAGVGLPPTASPAPSRASGPPDGYDRAHGPPRRVPPPPPPCAGGRAPATPRKSGDVQSLSLKLLLEEEEPDEEELLEPELEENESETSRLALALSFAFGKATVEEEAVP